MENFEDKIISTIEKILPAVVSVAISKDIDTIISEMPYFNFSRQSKTKNDSPSIIAVKLKSSLAKRKIPSEIRNDLKLSL